MTKAYSYIRFSTEKQKFGDSFRRQFEATQKFVDEHPGLVLDDTLSLHDLGISAYSGDNITIGKLGAFLNAVESGVVEPGSYLIVESLDRLSRNQVMKSLTILTQLVENDIVVVTLSDSKIYTRDNINNIADLIYSLIIFSRAHEESVTKSKRVKAAWDKKLEKAIEFKTPMTKLCPSWIELIDGQYQLKYPQADIAKRICDLYLGGHGHIVIAKRLNEEGVETFGFWGRKSDMWHKSYIKKMLDNVALIGTYKDIPDYFPRLISDEEFYEIQKLKTSKSSNSGGRRTSFSNIFTHLVKCGYCHGPMIRLNKARKDEGIGTWVYLVCNKGRMGVTDCSASGWVMNEFEDVVLKEISELSFETIFGKNDDGIKQLLNAISSSNMELEKLKNSKSNLVNAITLGGDIPALIQKLKEIEVEILQGETKLSGLNETLQIEQNSLSNSLLVQDYIRDLKLLDSSDARQRTNMELKKIIDRIEMFVKIKKFVIYYKNTKTKVRFKTGTTVTFPITIDDEKIDKHQMT